MELGNQEVASASPSPSSDPTIPHTSFIHNTTIEEEDEASVMHHSDHEGEDSAEDDHRREDSKMVAVASQSPKQTTPKRKGKRSFSKRISGSHSSQLANDPPQRDGLMLMTEADVGIFQRLDAEYDRAMEEREVAYAARYNSVRQSACFAVSFMVIYMTLGTVYFMKQADWTLEESLFFGIYTITTVGYGNLDNPETPAFQIYTVFFILIGIATLTIMVAQVYQCIALEAGRAQHSRDQSEMMRRGLDITAVQDSSHKNGGSSPRTIQQTIHAHFPVPLVERLFRCFDRIKRFLMHNEFGRGLSVLLPFLGLIVIGASVVGSLEGWTVVESIYFAVVSLTTTGYGDYFPTQSSSRIFCIIWLPFSVGFMSLYLGNIAAFYIRLSDRNIARIERHLRRKIDGLKSRAEREREKVRQRALRGQASTSSHEGLRPESERKGFDAVPTGEDESRNSQPSSPSRSRNRSSAKNQERRNRVIHNHLNQDDPKAQGSEGNPSATMSTMKNVLQAVQSGMKTSHSFTARPESEFLQFRSSKMVSKSQLQGGGSVRKPSFALRVLVQERFAEIIATEVAGYQNEISIKEATLTVTIDSLKDTSEKWLIPRRARRAFRAVAFEALYFVGEHGLITRGADALYALNPFEFHGLFAPLLAALGDAETMESWLASTEILAEYDLRQTVSKNSANSIVDKVPSSGDDENSGSLEQSDDKMIV